MLVPCVLLFAVVDVAPAPARDGPAAPPRMVAGGPWRNDDDGGVEDSG